MAGLLNMRQGGLLGLGHQLLADVFRPLMVGTACRLHEYLAFVGGELDHVAGHQLAEGDFAGLALAVYGGIMVQNGVDPKTKPITGQDAQVDAIQRILAGDQYMTVYKAIKKEADAASQLAIALIKGDTAAADERSTVGALQEAVGG